MSQESHKSKKKERTFQMQQQSQPEPLAQPEAERKRFTSEGTNIGERSSLAGSSTGTSSAFDTPSTYSGAGIPSSEVRREKAHDLHSTWKDTSGAPSSTSSATPSALPLPASDVSSRDAAIMTGGSTRSDTGGLGYSSSSGSSGLTGHSTSHPYSASTSAQDWNHPSSSSSNWGTSGIGQSSSAGSTGLGSSGLGSTGSSGIGQSSSLGSSDLGYGSTGSSGVGHSSMGSTGLGSTGSSGIGQSSLGSTGSGYPSASSSTFPASTASSGMHTEQPVVQPIVQPIVLQPIIQSSALPAGSSALPSSSFSGSGYSAPSSSIPGYTAGTSTGSSYPSTSSSGQSMLDTAKEKFQQAKDTVKEKYEQAKDTVKETVGGTGTSGTSGPSMMDTAKEKLQQAKVATETTGQSVLETAKEKIYQAKAAASSTVESAKLKASEAAEKWTGGKDKRQIARETVGTENVIAPEVLAKKSTKPEEELANETLVVFVDGSLASDKAFSYAVKHKQEGDILYFINIPRGLAVTQKGITVVKSLDTGVLEEVNRNLRDQSHQIIQHYEDKVRSLKLDRANGVTLDITSSPEDAAIDFLKEKGATLAFVGTRGLGSMQKFFESSFSQYLINNAPCAVMVVRCEASECERVSE